MSTDSNLNLLIGRKIISAKINQEKDVIVLYTDKGDLFLSWVGSCCSKCFIAHISGSDELIGSVINEIIHSEWKNISNGGLDEDHDYLEPVINSMGTTIKTDKGWVSIETRHSSNGYYSGWINISTQYPLDQYDNELTLIDEDMEPLKDF